MEICLLFLLPRILQVLFVWENRSKKFWHHFKFSIISNIRKHTRYFPTPFLAIYLYAIKCFKKSKLSHIFKLKDNLWEISNDEVLNIPRLCKQITIYWMQINYYGISYMQIFRPENKRKKSLSVNINFVGPTLSLVGEKLEFGIGNLTTFGYSTNLSFLIFFFFFSFFGGEVFWWNFLSFF